MKLSKYAYKYPLSDGKYIVHSAISGAIIVLNSVENQQMISMTSSRNATGELGSYLTQCRILLDDSFDEYKYFLHHYLSNKYSSNCLTVVPTMECNFACTYCSQAKAMRSSDYPVQMDINVLKKIKSLILSDGGPRSVYFYGGEPLLRPNIVKKVLSYCRDANRMRRIRIHTFIVTNGYLLNDNYAKCYSELGLSRAQVTIDGSADYHNRRRMLKGGGCTYDTIIDNIINASRYFHIDVRVNTEYDMIKSYDEVKNVFRNYPNIRVYSSATTDYNDGIERTRKNIESLVNRKKSKNIIDAYPNGLKACIAESLHGITVLPNGDYYKCWHQIGTQIPAGNMVTGEENCSVQLEWIGWNRFSNDICGKCKYLPLCNMKCAATTVLKEDAKMNCKLLVKKIHRRALMGAIQHSIEESKHDYC